MAKLFAHSGDPDQTPRSAASDLVLHCLPIIFYRSPDYNGLKKTSICDILGKHSNFIMKMYVVFSP